MTTTGDARTASVYRVAAVDLQIGDLVDTADGDWQEVLGVYRDTSEVTTPSTSVSADSSAGSTDLRDLVDSLDGRYVVVRLTDILPVDGGVYFTGGEAVVAGDDESDDEPVKSVASGEDGERIYLYTKYELVTIRSRS